MWKWFSLLVVVPCVVLVVAAVALAQSSGFTVYSPPDP